MTVHVINDDDDDDNLFHHTHIVEHCPTDNLLSPQVEYAIEAYRLKLSGYNRAELIQECKDRNRRGGNTRIGVSGSKADLMRRLLIDAARSLDASITKMGDDNDDIDGDVVNNNDDDDNDGDDNSDKDDDSDSDSDDQDEEEEVEEEDGATLELEVDSDNVYLSESVDDDDDVDDDAAKDSTRSHKTIRSSSSSSSLINRSIKDAPRVSSAHKTIHAMTTKKGKLDMRMRMRKHDSSDGGGDDDDMREVVMKVLRNCFGFTSFRPGQLWAIERCLTKKNSLLVLPTGAGKSLCYMLPAAVLAMTGGGGGGMGGLTIVVSPLIALMQVRATS